MLLTIIPPNILKILIMNISSFRVVLFMMLSASNPCCSRSQLRSGQNLRTADRPSTESCFISSSFSTITFEFEILHYMTMKPMAVPLPTPAPRTRPTRHTGRRPGPPFKPRAPQLDPLRSQTHPLDPLPVAAILLGVVDWGPVSLANPPTSRLIPAGPGDGHRGRACGCERRHRHRPHVRPGISSNPPPIHLMKVATRLTWPQGPETGTREGGEAGGWAKARLG